MNYESWGFTDKYTFLPSIQKPYVLDENLNTKLAYTTMVQTLKDFPRNSTVALAKLAQGNGEPLDPSDDQIEFL